MTPEVSVVLAVHDGERFVEEAVRSVLAQTFREFELVVVDDGSADGTPRLLDGFADPRIVRVRLDRNIGQPEALNRGLSVARCEWVARMDADDVCDPRRLERQMAYVRSHPDVGLLGTQVEVIDEHGRPRDHEFQPPVGVALIAWRLLLFTNPLCHSSVLYRRRLATEAGGYRTAFAPAEDRDLWSRMFAATRIENLGAPLLRLRIHSASLSARHAATQRASSLRVRRRLLGEWLGGDDPGAAIQAWYEPRITEAQVEGLVALLVRVFDSLVASGRFAGPELDAVREDLRSKLESIRRRDERSARKGGLRSLVPRGLREALRRFAR